MHAITLDISFNRSSWE